jgi:hypothetical protein
LQSYLNSMVSVTLPVGTGPAVTRVPGASDVFGKLDKPLTAPSLTLRRAALALRFPPPVPGRHGQLPVMFGIACLG